ncbi:MAG: hypothetical protein IMZ53_04910 [Thermoplasmata archaeon]|nr:hypothetical protein [Thermoplasmata archaeon]
MKKLVILLLVSLFTMSAMALSYDLTGDGVVNEKDLAVFAEGWLVNYDNVEFSEFANEWRHTETRYFETDVYACIDVAGTTYQVLDNFPLTAYYSVQTGWVYGYDGDYGGLSLHIEYFMFGGITVCDVGIWDETRTYYIDTLFTEYAPGTWIQSFNNPVQGSGIVTIVEEL